MQLEELLAPYTLGGHAGPMHGSPRKEIGVTLYAISATVTRREREGSRTRQVPTFYLDARVQGIVDEAHAEQVAKDIIDPFGDPADISVTAVKLGPTQDDRAEACKHCGRGIVLSGGRWIDPEASGDDVVWRETCEAHDSFAAEHEPLDKQEGL